MMRYPRLKEAIAKRYSERPEARLLLEEGKPEILLDTADIDGGSNIIAYSRIPEFPLYLSVVIDPKSELARWHSSRTIPASG